MKKILIFIDWYEPGFKAGGPIRSVKNLVDHLKGEASFYVFTRDRDYQSTDAYLSIQPDTWIPTEENVQVFYCSPENLKQATLRCILSERSYHKVYINGIYSWYFSILPLLLMRKEQKRTTIVAARGMLAGSAIGVKQGKKRLFLSLAKLLCFYKGVKFHATGIREKEDIQGQLGSMVPVKVAANFPAASKLSSESVKVKKKGELRLVSVARIAPEKNSLFALKVLAECPADIFLSLDLYGPVYDPTYWKDCQEVIDGLPDNIKVSYHGNLPNEQVHSYLQQYHFFYLPSRGENFGHSIFEAFTAALPVIISDQTPWRSLKEKKLGFDLSLDTEQFVAAIVEAAGMEKTTYNQWSKSAIQFAATVIEDPATLRAYREMFGM